MSTKKDKFLESAQRFIIRGQLDRAVKDLEQAISLDPGDIKVRQRIAELLVRLNRHEEAISEYETIGKFFSDSGFYLKAIAVYKQIQKLAPNKPKTTLTLAELNVKQGLIGNALAEFSQLVNLHVKNGAFPDAIEVLQRMHAIDPGNANTTLKLAETYLAAGNRDKAYEEYQFLAQQLFTRSDKTPLHRLGERISSLFPEKGWSVLSLAKNQLERGEHGAALACIKEIITRSPDSIDAWYLLADTIRAMGEMGQYRQALLKILQRFPTECRPVEELIHLALTDRNCTTSLDLLKQHRSHLLASGRSTQIEHFYLRIESLEPQSPDPLEGLSWLYRETRDVAKLHQVTSRMDALSSPAEPEELEELSPEEEIVAEEPVPTTPELPLEAETTQLDIAEEPEPEWEEEIQLGIDEEIVEDIPLQAIEPVPEEIAAPLESPVSIITDNLLPEPPSESATDLFLSEELPLVATEPPPEVSVVPLDITESMLGLEETDRTTHVIKSPLPFEAFLPPAPEPAVEAAPVSRIELPAEPPPPEPSPQAAVPDLVSLWEQSIDEALSDEMEIAAPPATTETRIPDTFMQPLEIPAASADDLLSPTIQQPPLESPAPELVLETEIIEDQSSGDHLEIESILDDDDLAIFTEALFGQDEEPAEDSGKYGLGDLLTAFKKGVDEQLDETDTETHYSLGIAYKEMGLYDEAVEEFRAARRDVSRASDCACLEGLCWRDKGDLEASERAFKEGLDTPSVTAEALLNLKYELARLYELSGRIDDATALYREILRVNIYFRDVSDRLSSLTDNDGLDILDPELLELDEEH